MSSEFDITAQPLLISARVPTSYWSVSVYSETAENVYTLNDTQAGVRTVRLLLVDEDEQARFLGSDDGGERPLNAIVVGTPEKTGLVLFRAFVSDHSRRDIVRADLEASNCRPFTLPATSGGGDGQRLSASPG